MSYCTLEEAWGPIYKKKKGKKKQDQSQYHTDRKSTPTAGRSGADGARGARGNGTRDTGHGVRGAA